MNSRDLIVVCLLAGLLATGCGKSAQDPAAAAASEAEAARSALPSVVPSSAAEPSAYPSGAPQPAALAKNPLYRAGRPAPSGCVEPASRPTSVAAVRQYYAKAIACLDKSWAPVVRKAGFAFRSPELVVTAGASPSSPCDFSELGAYYCNGTTIYIDANHDLKNFRDDDPSWALASMAFLIGHEYGHHLQALTGVLENLGERLLNLNGVDLYYQEVRRLELQASCLSGVFFGANRGWFPTGTDRLDQWRWTVRNSGDEWNPERDHGNKHNHGEWSLAGLESADPATCNTFTATSARVA